MLGDQYELEYLPLFDEELAEAVRYIAQELRNTEAAMKLVDNVEQAIQNRLFAPESTAIRRRAWEKPPRPRPPNTIPSVSLSSVREAAAHGADVI